MQGQSIVEGKTGQARARQEQEQCKGRWEREGIKIGRIWQNRGMFEGCV